jgi:hypothetical protein
MKQLSEMLRLLSKYYRGHAEICCWGFINTVATADPIKRDLFDHDFISGLFWKKVESGKSVKDVYAGVALLY